MAGSYSRSPHSLNEMQNSSCAPCGNNYKNILGWMSCIARSITHYMVNNRVEDISHSLDSYVAMGITTLITIRALITDYMSLRVINGPIAWWKLVVFSLSCTITFNSGSGHIGKPDMYCCSTDMKVPDTAQYTSSPGPYTTICHIKWHLPFRTPALYFVR